MWKKGSDAMMSSAPNTLERDGTVLVFGLEWFPLIGGEPGRQAGALARQQRASHRVVCVGGAVSVGLLRARLRRDRRRYCSAAAAFASLHPIGTVAALLTLPCGRRWLVGVHEGAVMTRTDHVHEPSFPVDDTIRLLREAHPGLVLNDDACAAPGLIDALFEAAQESGELLQGNRWLRVPSRRSALLLASLAAGSLVASIRLLQGTHTERPPQVEDALVAWGKAMDLAARAHVVHGVAGLHAALDTLQALPVRLADWRLAQAECVPGGDRWQCRARYRRGTAADNQGFISAAPPEWTLSFDPFEGAEAAWSTPLPALPLAAVSLRQSRLNEVQLVSALQAMLPAFSELRLEAPQPLPVSPPLDAERRPIARPPAVLGRQRRKLRVDAPLRSLAMLLPEAAHMSWERIVLQVAEIDHPSLRSSSLRVSLSGGLYEIEDGGPAVDGSVDSRAPARVGHDVPAGRVRTGHGA